MVLWRMAAVQNRVVLVTGASSGIGRSCAELLATRGYRVYGASRRPAPQARVEALPMDVRDDGSVCRAVASLMDREGRIDALVNSAGIALAGAVEDTSIEEARDQLEVNFFGALRVCRAVLPAMRRQRAGHIVNIGSIGGLVAIPYQGLYSASKFALEGLSESLRLEVSRFGVRVVLIEPGDHRTSLTANRRLAAGAERRSVYAERFERALARMASDEQGGPGPEVLARLIADVVETPKPRLRYTAGPAPERVAVWLKRLLPYAAVERIVSFYYQR
jgi:NAD(P)-dependent dehydrogenase (short-subunit alcohol dehydrogenase family)